MTGAARHDGLRHHRVRGGGTGRGGGGAARMAATAAGGSGAGVRTGVGVHAEKIPAGRRVDQSAGGLGRMRRGGLEIFGADDRRLVVAMVGGAGTVCVVPGAAQAARSRKLTRDRRP